MINDTLLKKYTLLVFIPNFFVTLRLKYEMK